MTEGEARREDPRFAGSDGERVHRCYINDYCISCRGCIEAAPHCFGLQGKRVVVLQQPERHELLNDFREAQALCPVSAIVLDVWKR